MAFRIPTANVSVADLTVERKIDRLRGYQKAMKMQVKLLKMYWDKKKNQLSLKTLLEMKELQFLMLTQNKVK